MGITRKFLSVTSLGAVDFRSDKERTAAYTRGTRTQAKKQTKIMREQTKIAQRIAAQQMGGQQVQQVQMDRQFAQQQDPYVPIVPPYVPIVPPRPETSAERLARINDRRARKAATKGMTVQQKIEQASAALRNR